MKRKIYLLIPLFLIILSLFFASCGGNNTGALPEISQQPQMVQKSVFGYIFHLPAQGVNDFIIIDAPVSGDDSFLNQMKSYLETNYPEVWNSAEIQSIYNQLSEEIADWQPLPEYNPGAQLFCAYSDTPIPVGEDGYFESVVSIPSGDENIPFEVVIGEEYFGAETIASSDFITSSTTGGNQLKCSNKSIIALPGGLSIFKVFSVPGTNLKEGLSFELDDNSIGTMTPPFFLKIKGELNYNLAYGIFKAGNITAKAANTKVSNGNGNNLYIPTDIVHETVSISGKVYTGGEPLIKGHVTSIGPKSSCFLDEEGNYVLPEVFKGAERKITATWWTGDQQGNNKTKHTEIRYIEYLDGDLTGFNFGVPPEPTPTATPTFPPPTDKYYEYISAQIIDQKLIWQKELGWEQGRLKTVEWLNRNLTEFPLSEEIEKAIEKAELDEYEPSIIRFYFKSGLEVSIIDPFPPETDSSLRSELDNKSSDKIITNQNLPPITVKNMNVLMLASKSYEDRWHKEQMFGETNSIKSYFEEKNFTVTDLGIMNYELSESFLKNAKTPNQNDITKAQVLFTNPVKYYDNDDNVFRHVAQCQIINNMVNTVPRPSDFVNMNDYGVIYIDAHGLPDGIMACLDYQGDWKLQNWLEDPNNKDKWCYGYKELSILYDERGWELWWNPDDAIYFRCIVLKYPFFATPNDIYGNDDFTETFVYLNACYGWEFFNTTTPGGNKPFPNVQVFISAQKEAKIKVNGTSAYSIFKYMLAMGTNEPPMSAGDAWSLRNSNIMSDDNKLKINNENDTTYLPANTNIFVNQN